MARVALLLSILGFVLSRFYPSAANSLHFIALDYFLAVAMIATHAGFCVGTVLLARSRSTGSRWGDAVVLTSLAAVVVGALTFVWVP